MAVHTKESRIDIRLLAEDKKTLEKAASLKRLTLSAYILSVAIEAARMDIEREETMTFADNARDQLLALLENPPEPTEKLKALFR